MKETALSILGLIILFFPTALKVWRDRKGVKLPDPTFFIFILLIFACGLNTWIWIGWGEDRGTYLQSLILIIKYSIVSASFYASIFPYWINYVHLKNNVIERKKIFFSDADYFYMIPSKKEVRMHILSHLSKTAWPNRTWWWIKIGWQGRLIVNGLILGGGLYLYFV